MLHNPAIPIGPSMSSSTSEAIMNKIFTSNMNDDWDINSSGPTTPTPEHDGDLPVATRPTRPTEISLTPSSGIYEECRNRLLPIIMMSAKARDPSRYHDSEMYKQRLTELFTDAYSNKFLQYSNAHNQQLQTREVQKATVVVEARMKLKREWEDDVTMEWNRNVSQRRRVDSEAGIRDVASSVSRKDSEVTLVDFPIQQRTMAEKLQESPMEGIVSTSTTTSPRIQRKMYNLATTTSPPISPSVSVQTDATVASTIPIVATPRVERTSSVLTKHIDISSESPSVPLSFPEQCQDMILNPQPIQVENDTASSSAQPPFEPPGLSSSSPEQLDGVGPQVENSAGSSSAHTSSADPAATNSNEITDPYQRLVGTVGHTQGPPYTVPGLWFMTPGLQSTGLLDIEFEVPSDLTTVKKASTEVSFKLHLLCLPKESVAELVRNASSETLGDKIGKASVSWPSNGNIMIHMNPGSVRSCSWLPRDLNNKEPLEVTTYTSLGKNILRIVQFGDLSEYTFVLRASSSDTQRLWIGDEWAKLIS